MKVFLFSLDHVATYKFFMQKMPNKHNILETMLGWLSGYSAKL
jgi:hypothetical protein